MGYAETPERTGYRRLNHSTTHEHQADGVTVQHEHSAGATKHWHRAGSGAPEFGPEGQPAGASMVLVEMRTCGKCQQPVIYWGGDFRHLADGCP